MPDTPLAADAPTFVLGVGAQKAGTSWVYDYLNGHPDCAMTAVKEMHVFDLLLARKDNAAVALQRLQRLRGTLRKEIARAKEGRPFAEDGPRLTGFMDCMAMQYQPDRYAHYFRTLRARHPGARVIGEITPNYATLTVDNYRAIRRIIEEEIGARPKVVFLLRDPVERCWSQQRMVDRMAEARTKRKGKGKAAGKKKRADARERFGKAARAPRAQGLTRYENTIRNLEQVFSADEVFYGLYEELFTEAEVARLCAFLGIATVDPKFDVVKNASPRTTEPKRKDVAQVRAFYGETYAFCRERFGEKIDRLWTPAMRPVT